MTMAEDNKARRGAMVPLTTIEEAPILTDEERVAMIASLKAAEARIAAAEHIEHEANTFVDRLLDVGAAAIRNKKA
jgi:hypothetical protein